MKNRFPILNLPPLEAKLRRDGDQVRIFDPLRKKYVVLTPEEYVRQHFVNWLTGTLGYPPGVIANEIGLTLNDTQKRCDTVVFGPDCAPMMIVEYKAPHIAITQEVFDQIVRYNMKLRARYLVVSNGLNHYCCVADYRQNTYQFIPRVPEYREAKNIFSEN